MKALEAWLVSPIVVDVPGLHVSAPGWMFVVFAFLVLEALK